MAKADQTTPDILDAVIIGAGFSGLYQLHSLRDKLGLNALVLEKGDGIGGTWYWNRYPGARCDSESHAYAYYFSEELLQNWDWSERYPGQAEILRYLNYCADQLDLKRDIRLNTKLTAARYLDEEGLWQVETEQGDPLKCRFLITAVGCLSTANIPDIPGLEDFGGRWFHTGQWPHEGVDFTGRRVGLVGTGSTGIQVVPVVAEEADHLTVFQRTANYSVPAGNHPLNREFQDYAKAHTGEIRQIMHSNTNGHAFPMEDRSAVETPPEEREAIYRDAWNKGGLQFRTSFRDILLSEEANATASNFIRDRVREIVKDPQKAEDLSNFDHPFGAKRPPIDTDYFETYNRDNVDLVNLRKTPIEAVTKTGIRTSAGEVPLDDIIFATGFDAMTGSLLSLNITGAKGLTLDQAWEEGPKNYLGLQVAGFPNLFTITGPGSPSVLTNMPVAIEQHVEWITRCIGDMIEGEKTRIEPKQDAVDRWVEKVNAAANATLFPKAHHSWYLGANIPGKPRVFMPYSGGMARYRKICTDIADHDYEGFDRS